MMSISEFQEAYTHLKSTNTKINSVSETNMQEHEKRIFQTFSDFLNSKFYETSKIFQKFDFQSMTRFCKDSKFEQFEENQKIFSKGEECDCYYFILFGDINLYEQDCTNNSLPDSENKQNKLMKTMSAGSVYGHKIKSSFNFFAVAKNSTSLLKITKTMFDNIIVETNKRKDLYKLEFLKKFFPKLRMYSDDILNPLRNFFIREEYYKGGKILLDSEYDEYVYLVINGALGVAKSVRKIKNMKDKFLISGKKPLSSYTVEPLISDNSGSSMNSADNFHLKYVILEKLNRGDVFGAYSALKHQKNNYTVIVLSERAQIYKLSKAHCLYYFGGSSGIIPESLRGIDTAQQSSLNYKLDFLEKCENSELTSKFSYLNEENENSLQAKKIIDESIIENNLKNAWKELENLGSKITQFKDTLLNKATQGFLNKPNDLFAKPKTSTNDVECMHNIFKYIIFKQIVKDHSKIMGFATTRVVGKNLNKNSLSALQMKGMSTLQNICAVKKNTEPLKENDNMMLTKITAFGESAKKNKIMETLGGIDKNSMEEGSANQPYSLNVTNKFKKFKTSELLDSDLKKEGAMSIQCEENKTNSASDDIDEHKSTKNPQSLSSSTQEKANEPAIATSNNLNRNPKKTLNSLKNLL